MAYLLLQKPMPLPCEPSRLDFKTHVCLRVKEKKKKKKKKKERERERVG